MGEQLLIVFELCFEVVGELLHALRHVDHRRLQLGFLLPQVSHRPIRIPLGIDLLHLLLTEEQLLIELGDLSFVFFEGLRVEQLLALPLLFGLLL